MSESTRLVCPVCGHPSFEWTVTEVVSGDIHTGVHTDREVYGSEHIEEQSNRVKCRQCFGIFYDEVLIPEEDE